MANKVFNVAVFFVCFRECLEAAIIVSVLLSFVDRTVSKENVSLRRRLKKQLWLGVALGLLICLAIGGATIGVYYRYQNDIYGPYEDIWESVFAFIASIMISMMGIPMLRISKMKAKWRLKFAQALVEGHKEKGRWKLGHFVKRYALFMLPFVTVLREGLEAVVFVAGVGAAGDVEATSYPLPVVVGLLAGAAIGMFLYYGATRSSMQIFLVCSTCLLYLIAAGLFSRGAWYIETYKFNTASGGDASENGSGNGSYNILRSVYHVNCCNPEMNDGWGIFNAIFGWQNTGYLSSILCYIFYWVALIVIVSLMIFEEKRGHLPFTQKRLSDLNPFRIFKRKQISKDEEEILFAKAKNVNFNREGHLTTT
ncbi:HFL050Wp [Eremothecium sinecaudum]|uniref:HFL050Wp n=1 Tax=Eremothecium sinecaudum TaxID=45286 RepID=A0A0X8HU00_9SACH|nr:HFL050Wp [Eremothecium sinecaudum]AMD21806.1 HFL050Wp [Eremothecium sinecaudum]